MKELMDINIPNEFRNFVESLDDELRDLFNYYCLGIRKNSEFVEGYTLDHYIELVREALQKKSNLGFRYVVYKCITSDHTLVTKNFWKKDNILSSKTLYNSTNLLSSYNSVYGSTQLWSCYVAKGNEKYKFKADFMSLDANPSFIFFLHPSIQSYDAEEIALFASIWDERFHEMVRINPIPKFMFVVGNSKRIFTGNTPPTHEEIKKHHINLNMIIPIKSIAYEEE